MFKKVQSQIDQWIKQIKTMGNSTKRKTRSGSKRKYKGVVKQDEIPKQFWKRWVWYMHPQRFRDFWFTKKGAIAAAKIAGVMFVLGVAFIAALFLYFAKDLPNPGQINTQELAQTTKIYDRSGEHLLHEIYGDEKRDVTDLDEMSPYIKNATIAIEDKDFYNHGAFSFVGIIRAAINNVLNREITGGGSTITQQYVKNALLSSEQTITRKIKELILSIQIEQLYDKDDILELYLNEIPYGYPAYGAEAAAQTFFGKSSAELTIDEAALLAALPQAPGYYSPYGENTDILISRQETVIDRMAEQGYITQEEAEEAKKVDVMTKIQPPGGAYSTSLAPHFTILVQNQLEEEFGAQAVNEGGLKVITTLDYDLQKIAQEAVHDNISNVENPANGARGGDNASLVAADPATGQVYAMQGSRDFNYPEYGTFNASLAGRQPGSSFKPYGYATLFKEDNWGPGSIMYDVPTDFGNYKPNNFDNGFKGAMTVRRALAESRNIPAVKALYMAGVENVIEQAQSMGITTLNDGPGTYGLSLVLGAGEVRLYDHVNAYTAFANGGIHRDPVTMLKVENADGEVIKEYEETEGERVLDEQIAYSITSMLSDDAARSGTFGRGNSNLTVPGYNFAVKTGSTDESRDGWMMGYSNFVTAGVWVGNHDNVPMDSANANAFTSQLTGPIWTQFMARAHEQKEWPNEPYEQPAAMKTLTLDRLTGRLPADNVGDDRKVTDIFPSWYQAAKANNQEAVIDKVSKKLATECTPELAKEKINASSIQPEIPPTDPAYSRWAEGLKTIGGGEATTIPTENDDAHDCGDERPEVSVSANKVSGGTYDLKAVVDSGKFPANKLDFKVNGQIVSSQGISGNGTYTYRHSFDSTGNFDYIATVTDEGYYQAEDSEKVNVSETGGGSSSSFQLYYPGNGDDIGNTTTFSWGEHDDATSYKVFWSGPESGSANSITEEHGSVNLNDGNYTWWVEAWKGATKIETTNKNSFTVN